LRIAKNDAFVDMQLADGRAEYCPRRKRLDGLLQDAATRLVPSCANAPVSSRCCKKASGWSGCARQTGRTRDIRCGSRKWCFETRNQSPELRTRLARVAEYTLSPYDVLPAATVLRWTLGGCHQGVAGTTARVSDHGQARRAGRARKACG
jgi:hypothetical protein